MQKNNRKKVFYTHGEEQRYLFSDHVPTVVADICVFVNSGKLKPGEELNPGVSDDVLVWACSLPAPLWAIKT